MPIRILDAATVGRIAAGEVVERPSSVVKELIENSLDAGASSITVEVKGGGVDYLRVTDNGCGIDPSQVRLAFENHATSKLQRAEQLDDIRTLGFRGEALPSIAAVSRVEMTTRARGQESGMRLTVEGGENMRVQETGCPQGTTLVMRDLFFNIPVRRAFLKKPSYEAGLVSDAVARLMLGNPNVSMRFINGGTTLYHSFGDGKLRHAVFAVYGRAAAENMVELDASEGGVRIHGLIGVGELAKATRAHQMFFINGRSVRCPMISRALEQVCRGRVTIGMYPMCVLNLVLPPTAVDVNVHPNKLEVRFRDEEMMRTACERLLSRAFEGERVLEIEKLTAPQTRMERRAEVREIPVEGSAVPSKPASDAKPDGANFRPQMPPLPVPPRGEQMRLDLNAGGARMFREDRLASGAPLKVIDLSASDSENGAPAAKERAQTEARLAEKPVAPSEKSGNAQAEARLAEKSAAPSEKSSSVQTEARLAEKPAAPSEKSGSAPQAGSAPAGAASSQTSAVSSAEVSNAADVSTNAVPTEKPAASAPSFRVIGVAFRTYILVEAGDTLLLIDQHAAHERLQYERYMARARAGAASQQLLTPLVLELSAREMAVLMDNQDVLSDAGYAVEPFGERDVRVTAVPFVMGRAELRPLFLEMVQSLNQLKAATVDARRSEIMQMACKSAVKAGDVLSDSEIASLIQSMLETGAPPTCPHGRPVVKAISRRELEKMFKRIQ